jgi:hypothetical protein
MLPGKTSPSDPRNGAVFPGSLMTLLSVPLHVGVPHYSAISPAQPMFYKNVEVGGGPAPVRGDIDELLPDVLDGTIEPGRVFDRTVASTACPTATARWPRATIKEP